MFERSRQDPKISQYMAKTDKYMDDEQGRLVRLEDAQRAGNVATGVIIGSGKRVAAPGAPPGEKAIVTKKGRRRSAEVEGGGAGGGAVVGVTGGGAL